jgi:lysozyme
VSWIQIFTNGYLCEMDASGNAISCTDTKKEVNKLIEALKKSSSGQYVIADPTKPLPTVTTTLDSKSAASSTKPFLRLTKTDTTNAVGLVNLLLSLVDKGGAVVDSLPIISGQPWAQEFRTADVSHSGSMEPLPEGYWTVGDLEFASGVKGNYGGEWSSALGPVYVELNCTSPTGRGDIGIHLDANAEESPGTAGCVGIPKAGADDLDNLRKFVGWFANSAEAPERLVVNWGLKTVET